MNNNKEIELKINLRGVVVPIDWVNGLIGGLLIGCAGAIYLLMSGKVMGASGVLSSFAENANKGVLNERGFFLIGLICLPAFLNLLGLLSNAITAQTNLTNSLPLVIISGIFVGIGTRLARGCTSGHGVCGISRFSLRGIIATLVFVCVGVATVAIFKQLLGII